MFFFRGTIIFALALFVCFLNGCKRYDDVQNINAPTPDLTQSANANNAANLAKDDPRELNQLVRLPFEPDEDATVWREMPLTKESTDEKKLVAVMKFTEEEAQKLIESASKYQPAPQNVQATTETWFPAELIAASSVSGNDTLKGTAYAADDFFQAPYTQGRLIKIDETGYFILELTAM